MNTVRLATMLLACAALIVGGCSNSEQPKAKAPENTIDPCSYLTSADIEAVLGWKVATIEHSKYGGCKYRSATPITMQGLQTVDVLIGQGMPEMSSSKAMAAWRKKQGEDYNTPVQFIVEPVEGLGVPAIVSGVENLLAIEMDVGGKLISVASVNSQEKARKLGEKVMTHVK